MYARSTKINGIASTKKGMPIFKWQMMFNAYLRTHDMHCMHISQSFSSPINSTKKIVLLFLQIIIIIIEEYLSFASSYFSSTINWIINYQGVIKVTRVPDELPYSTIVALTQSQKKWLLYFTSSSKSFAFCTHFFLVMQFHRFHYKLYRTRRLADLRSIYE